MKLTLTLRFRLVALQVTELQDCPNEDSLDEQLGSLPIGLDEFYDQIVSKINKKYRGDVLKFLQWLAFSFRPLKLDEIMHVPGVVTDPKHDVHFKLTRAYRDATLVLQVCSGLVTCTDARANGESKLQPLCPTHGQPQEQSSSLICPLRTISCPKTATKPPIVSASAKGYLTRS